MPGSPIVAAALRNDPPVRRAPSAMPIGSRPQTPYEQILHKVRPASAPVSPTLSLSANQGPRSPSAPV
eukprot:gene12523-10755_t